MKKKINFLGYVIEKGTIRPSEDKTKAVEHYPTPKDKKTHQRFFGLTSYFRRFVEGYTAKVKPLSDLLRKDALFTMGTRTSVSVVEERFSQVASS